MKLHSRKLQDNLNQRSVEFIRREFSVDIAEKEMQQLTSEMIETSGENRWPDYLREGGKVMFWDIPDPFGQTDAFADDVDKQVRQRVEQLVTDIG